MGAFMRAIGLFTSPCRAVLGTLAPITEKVAVILSCDCVVRRAPAFRGEGLSFQLEPAYDSCSVMATPRSGRLSR